MNTNPKPATQLTPYESILAELRGLKDDMHTLRQELKETRTELNGRMNKLDEKLEDVRKETRSAMRHSQIMVMSSVAIALGVLYAIFFK
ncbi:MAG: hypothetical protein SR1Q7_06665 [Quinella sp. 1Q7]|nr:hypothetical protein [Quinella sp. 1Q7]